MSKELTIQQWQELWQLTEDHKEVKATVNDLANKVDKIYGAIIGNELGQEGIVDQMKLLRHEVHAVKNRVDQIERQQDSQKAWRSGAMWVAASVASVLTFLATKIFK